MLANIATVSNNYLGHLAKAVGLVSAGPTLQRHIRHDRRGLGVAVLEGLRVLLAVQQAAHGAEGVEVLLPAEQAVRVVRLCRVPLAAVADAAL